MIEAAKEREVVLISTPYDTFNAARLINQSMPCLLYTSGILRYETDGRDSDQGCNCKDTVAAEPVCDPVSYTHLDVYKRQSHDKGWLFKEI